MKKIIVLTATLFIISAGVFAQEKAGKKDTANHTVIYTCVMHPDIRSDNPGKCPQCNMDLQLSKKEQLKRGETKNYNCPAHLDVITEKPGKCTICGKNLNRSKKEQMKLEIVKKYSCPMHPEEVSDKAVKCSKCKMDMVEKKVLPEERKEN